MPMLTDADLATVLALAQPIADQARRADFVAAVTAAAPQGPGQTHRIARDLQRQFFDPPTDTREGTPQPRRRISLD